jgi:hypothetical protein
MKNVHDAVDFFNPTLSEFAGKIAKDFKYPGTRIKRGDVLSDAVADLDAEGIAPTSEITQHDDSLYVGACSSIGLKWPAFTFVSMPTTQRPGIRVVSTITKARFEDHTVFLIPSDDSSFTAFVITPPASGHE